MQQYTGQKDDATSNTQQSAKKTDNKNYSIFEETEIAGTPFKMTRHQKMYAITIGGVRLTEPTTTEEEQLEKLTNEMWTIVLKLSMHVHTRMKEHDDIKLKAQVNMAQNSL